MQKNLFFSQKFCRKNSKKIARQKNFKFLKFAFKKKIKKKLPTHTWCCCFCWVSSSAPAVLAVEPSGLIPSIESALSSSTSPATTQSTRSPSSRLPTAGWQWCCCAWATRRTNWTPASLPSKFECRTGCRRSFWLSFDWPFCSVNRELKSRAQAAKGS